MLFFARIGGCARGWGPRITQPVLSQFAVSSFLQPHKRIRMPGIINAQKLLRTVALALLIGSAAMAQKAGTLIIQNDRGGAIGARLIAIAQANSSRTRIELRGRICYSSCTLYLGADDIRVSPDTVLAFTGPAATVDRYPMPNLSIGRKSWLRSTAHRARLVLNTARHRTTG